MKKTDNEEFISKDKLSKGKKKELAKANRNVWTINPITRVPKNSKAYDRNKQKMWRQDTD